MDGVRRGEAKIVEQGLNERTNAEESSVGKKGTGAARGEILDLMSPPEISKQFVMSILSL